MTKKNFREKLFRPFFRKLGSVEFKVMSFCISVQNFMKQAQCIMDLPDDKYRMEMKKEIKKNLQELKNNKQMVIKIPKKYEKQFSNNYNQRSRQMVKGNFPNNENP